MDATDVRQPRTRRALLAGGLTALGAAAAHALGRVPGTQAAAGQPLVMGSTTNSAGTSNTTLTTNSSGIALLVTQTGSGTALRGSATANDAIAGFFTSANGPGVSGVTAKSNKYAVFAGHNATTTGNGAALRATGNKQDGIVATTDVDVTAAVYGSNGASGFATALWGFASNPFGAGTAVYGDAAGPLGTAVMGIASSLDSVGDAVGVYGESGAGLGYGVVGVATGQAEAGVAGTGPTGVSGTGTIGVYGTSSESYAVIGNAYQTAGAVGVKGQSDSLNGIGVYAVSNHVTSGTGLFAMAVSSSGLAIDASGDCRVTGDLEVTGTVTGATSTTRIDHPLEPAQRFLEHAAVESAERKTVYDGLVTLDDDGEATVELPAWMEALNGDFRYQLTSLDRPSPDLHVARRIKDGSFLIAGGRAGADVSWQVTGIRRDAWAKRHPVQVEVDKTGQQRGRYLHPAEHGRSAKDAIRQPRSLPEAGAKAPKATPKQRQRPQRRPD